MNELPEGPRRSFPPVRVWVTPMEKRAIAEMAVSTGESASSYLRKIGLGYTVRSVLDYQRVGELSKVNADLGRLGGLMKLWLANEKALAGFSQDELRTVILSTLDGIQACQREMLLLIHGVVNSKI